MKNIIQISLVLSCFVLLSCKKDKIVPALVSSNPIQDNCPEMYEIRSAIYPIPFVKSDLPLGCAVVDLETMGDYFYIKCVLNPSNPYEFAFFRRNFASGNSDPDNYEVGVYNFCRNETKILKTNMFSFTTIDFSSKGWIIFRADNAFQKVKSNGDSLTVLNTPNNISSNLLRWSPDGSKLISSDGYLNKNVILNEMGEVIQELPFGNQHVFWYSNHEIIHPQVSSGFNTYNLNTEQSSSWSNVNLSNFSPYEISHFKNNKLYVSNQDAVYEVENNSISVIDSNFQTYDAIMQPINGELFLVQRFITDIVDPCNRKIYSYASIYNRNTQTEKMIQIP